MVWSGAGCVRQGGQLKVYWGRVAGGVIAPPAPPWRAGPANRVTELSADGSRHPRLQPQPSTATHSDNTINKADDIAEDHSGLPFG